MFFTLQSQNSNYANSIPFVGHKKGEAADQAAESIGYNNDKMTAHDTAGFTIAFAHMNFQDNPDWEKAFDNAQNGDLNITSYPEYDFGDYNVKAPAQGAVYVVTPEGDLYQIPHNRPLALLHILLLVQELLHYNHQNHIQDMK